MFKSHTAFLLFVSLISVNSVFAQFDDNPTGDDVGVGAPLPAPPKFDDNPTGGAPRPVPPKFDDNQVRRPPTFNNTNTADSASSGNAIEFPNYVYLTSFFYLFV